MVIAANLGLPRIGHRRELKKALEQFWSNKSSEEELIAVGKNIRKHNWQLQKDAGIDHIPSNDFSFYDHMLDAAITFGAVPPRYRLEGKKIGLREYFVLARGGSVDGQNGSASGEPAMEMTKWFYTNYHYIVPELQPDQSFALLSRKPIEEFQEAKALGIHTRPVLIGPVSFLLLSKVRAKGREDHVDKLSLLPNLLPAYLELLGELKKAGADWVQIDEPCLVVDPEPGIEKSYQAAYKEIVKSGLKIVLTTYFSRLGQNLETVFKLPVNAVHLDLVHGGEDLDKALSLIPPSMQLSAGVIDGHNVWTNNLDATLAKLEKIRKALGEDRLIVAPSCSLLHVPPDLDEESKIDQELKSWLSFAKQKIHEVTTLTRALKSGRDSVAAQLSENSKAVKSRSLSPRVKNAPARERLNQISDHMLSRISNYATRNPIQRELLKLPLLPTTTIGSFPQTKEVRQHRANLKSSKITEAQYDELMEAEIKRAVSIQEEIGLDVLVHGEFERNDMVEYFAENLDGYIVTDHGWVQSYGSRYVKPPILFGDIVRPKPITVRWSKYAQSLTKKVIKGMLTGPVTMLQWSFVRDDQPRSQTCQQLALIIRDEVVDLEKGGIRVIQIDEPAIREGLPLHKEDWKEYLNWAVKSFRLAAGGVQDQTQIHTHMCYSEFNDIIDSVAALDADVVSIETARSHLELLDAFVRFKYPNEIGPGVYDIHSPRVPPESEVLELLDKALKVISPSQLWVNPDCGLKTRRWEEVTPALQVMVEAARKKRVGLSLPVGA
jgi:5-methyltetrahydropteroyltriglutamate--homocysteine methyltransferase